MSDRRHESEALSDWLDADPCVESANHEASVDTGQLADELVVHGLLRDVAQHDDAREEHRITRLLSEIDRAWRKLPACDLTTDDKLEAYPTRTRFVALAGAAGLAACLLIAFVVLRPGSLGAAEALDRIIHSAAQSIDRAYEIHVLEEYRQRRRSENLTEQQWLAESAENVDGAMLYVGGSDRHVFARFLSDGRQRVSGCDGRESWSFREDGPVHVSGDLTRFQGKIPGQQQSIAFIDLYSQLTLLRDGYDIELSEETGGGGQIHRLVGERKSRDVRGPKSITLLFDRNDGTIHRMVLDGLPRGHGGPKRVELVLVSHKPMEDGFYSHAFHHDGQRKIKREEALP